jgi:cobaltochelatase CobS
MSDISNIQPDSRTATVLEAPDQMKSVRDLFGIDSDMQVPVFSEADERVPDLDGSYVFDPDTTLAICAGFAHNRRVMVQGYHGTGKSAFGSTWTRTSAGSTLSGVTRLCCATASK